MNIIIDVKISLPPRSVNSRPILVARAHSWPQFFILTGTSASQHHDYLPPFFIFFIASDLYLNVYSYSNINLNVNVYLNSNVNINRE